MTILIKHEIDTCGTCCPIPMISTIKTLNRLNKGDIIKVLATDHGFLNDIRVLEAVSYTHLTLPTKRIV